MITRGIQGWRPQPLNAMRKKLDLLQKFPPHMKFIDYHCFKMPIVMMVKHEKRTNFHWIGFREILQETPYV